MSGLSLNEWFQEMGFNVWHAFQLADSTLVPVTASCQTILYDRASANADRAGRRDVARSIEAAEQLIKRHAGFWPSPRYVEVTRPYPRLGDRRLQRLWDVDPQGRWVSVTLPDAYVQALGPETETGSSTEALTYTDEDGDGLSETATLTATVPSGTTAAEVVCRFLTTDCGPVTPRPEPRPRSVSVSGVTATVVLDTWELVRPVRTAGFYQMALNPTVLPPNVASPFASSLEVFRRRADPTGTTTGTAMALLTWETRPAPGWLPACCDGTSSDPAATRQAIARVTIRDGRAGVVALGEAVYDATTGTWSSACDWRCDPPDRVTIRYQAGYPLDGIRMDPAWRTVVARLAAAELARPVCACDGANRELYEWQYDRARTGATSELFQAPTPNPLGTRRGHIYAWDQIVRDQRLQGIYAG